MTKRCQIILKTREAEILQELRILRNLSVRKAADLIGVSHTMVNHVELGRANITESYIENFLKALNISKEDWNSLLRGQRKIKSQSKLILTEECIRRIQDLSEEKLRILQVFLAKL